MSDVLCCGVPRSGSTLIWQVTTLALPGRKVRKSHPASWKQNGNPELIVGSIRNPYDIMASRFRARIANDRGDGSQESVVGTKSGLLYELRGMKSNYDAHKMLMRKYRACMIVLRYEDFFEHFAVIFDALERSLSVAIGKGTRREITRRHSFAENQRRALQLQPGADRVDRMGVAHVGLGIPGTWKAIIPAWGYDLMKKWCDPICEEFGYASQH